MISTIVLLVSPFVINLITAGVKKIEKVQLSDYRISVIRVIVAVLSFVTVILTALMKGEHVDATSIQTISETLVVFGISTGVYVWGKYKAKKGLPQ